MKPALPKRLASRIRGAQQAVTRARCDIFHDAPSLADYLARIAEYESDPMAFADRHYRGHGPDSYPVQTNIGRARDAVERRRARHDSQLAALKAADQRLENVEAEVMAEVMAIKSSTGRVPWPRALTSFETDREADERDRVRDKARDAIEFQRDRERDERQFEREMAVIQRQSDREDAAEARRWARLSPEKRAALKEELRPWIEAIESGDITIWDILSGRATLRK